MASYNPKPHSDSVGGCADRGISTVMGMKGEGATDKGLKTGYTPLLISMEKGVKKWPIIFIRNI